MKHRLASQGPTGRLWPTFPILLLFFSFFFFFCGGINAVPPSPSSFHLGVWWALRRRGCLGWGMRGCLLLHVCHFFLRDLKARSGGGGREIEGTAD